MSPENGRPLLLYSLRAVVAVIILLTGEGLRRGFAAMKKPPEKRKLEELVLSVTSQQAQISDHLIELQGFGKIRSRDRLVISPEVGGLITTSGDKLENGAVVKAGQLLFAIDPRDYRLAVSSRHKRIATLMKEVAEVSGDIPLAAKALELRRQATGIAEKRYRRQQKLAAEKIVTEELSDSFQQLSIQAAEAELAASRQLRSLKNRLGILESSLAESRELLKVDELRLQRCKVTAPAEMRILSHSIEKGSLAIPAAPLITLENPDAMEIAITLPGPEAYNWLQTGDGDSRWFERLKKIPCDISWQGGERISRQWQGVLERAEKYDAASRQLTVVAALNRTVSKEALSGMFCKVRIPGKMIRSCVMINRVSLKSPDLLMTIDQGRLKFIRVDVLRDTGDTLYIRSPELKNGVKIVTSRISDPIAGIKLTDAGND